MLVDLIAKNGGNLLNSAENEKYKHTSFVCEECGSKVVKDIFKSECYCLHRGLIREIVEYDTSILDTISN